MVGTIYLLHFKQAFGHARHYLGWTRNLAQRVAAHTSGRGARLTAAASAAGIEFVIARRWRGDRHEERRLKNMGSRARLCPICREQA
jgi:predicted GIY-YIG superfamily endonuclease